MNKLYFQCADI